MSESVSNVFPYLTGATLGLALLLFLVSFRLFRRSRNDVYWRKRRDAGQRGWRIFVLGSVLIVVSGVSCLLTILAATVWNKDDGKPAATSVADQATPTATLPGSLTPSTPSTAIPTPAQTATPVVVIVTTTPVFTPTETPFPTFTPYVTPPTSAVTPLPNARIAITALDDQISSASTPLNPRTTFDAGIKRLYLFIEFENMEQGVMWTRSLYRDGELVESGSYLWGLNTDGTTYFFFGNETGFEPGSYEVRLFIGDAPTPASTVTFVVVPTS
jgi:hypothetical protein